MIIKSDYNAIRPQLRTGDIVFFGGKDGWTSRIIRWFTLSPYSHAAIVWRTEEDRVVLMESTTLLGKSGVQRSYLSERAADYRGIVDIAVLSAEARRTFDIAKCDAFLESVEGRRYDRWGALLSGPGQWLRIPGRERAAALFCSELADLAHRAGGLIIGRDRTPTPEELSRRNIFAAFHRVKES